MLRFCHPDVVEGFRRRFGRLYGEEQVEPCMRRLHMLIGRYGLGAEEVRAPDGLWSETDVVLITYADMVRDGEGPSLPALKAFLDARLEGVVSVVHILPFFPYSSDDGFSVIDYRAVHKPFGDWLDVEALGEHFDLMFDLVLNHCSRKSAWFRDYCNGIAPGRHYFIAVDPETDLSSVVRPRSLPLLTKVQTRRGERHLWTTFSADQVDLDFSNPDVLFEFLDILFGYVARGCRIVRLDAIAYLWKTLGTSCIHLPETHEVVKLYRDVLALVAPRVILLTETNVPHAENISYFGNGDEASMVYQFSLPPLLLQALTSGESTHLTAWAQGLEPPPPGCTFFNFSASHDGVGVRPLEGLVPEAERDALCDALRARGAHVSTKRNSDGTDSPYEINVSYFEALGDEAEEVTEDHIQRFLCSQSIVLAFRGVPAIYFHSLTATANWHAGVDDTGMPRTINRRKWEAQEIELLLEDVSTATHRVFQEYCRRVRVRRSCRAFHPDAPQTVYDLGPALFVLRRDSVDTTESVLCLFNVTAVEQPVTLAGDLVAGREDCAWTDLLAPETTCETGAQLTLPPYGVAWLQSTPAGS